MRTRALGQAFFSKNRGHWKQFSSRELDAVGPRPEGRPLDERFPQDLSVKKGYSPSEQMGVAIAALTEKGQMELVEWTKQVCSVACAPSLPGLPDTSEDANSLTTGCVVDLDSVYRASAADHRRRGRLVVKDDRLEQYG